MRIHKRQNENSLVKVRAISAVLSTFIMATLFAAISTTAFADTGTLTAGGVTPQSDSSSYTISQKTLTFYDGSIIECYESFTESPREWGSSVMDRSAPPQNQERREQRGGCQLEIEQPVNSLC